MGLLSRLIERQQRENISDRAMARRLGVARSTWTRIRTGTYGGMTYPRLVRGALRAYPELAAEVLSHLRDEDNAEVAI